GANGGFVYTPNANFNGADAFTYSVADGKGGTATAQVALTVNPVNDAPVAAGDSYAVNEDGTLNVTAALGVLANDTDIDGDPLTAALVGGPANGAVTLGANGGFVYTPNANFNGADGFTYSVSDGTGGSATAQVALTVNPVNDAPVAVGDSYAVGQNGILSIGAVFGVLANDGDVDGDKLSAALVNGPANGALTLNGDGSFTYTPNLGFTGTDGFTYSASDGKGGSHMASSVIAVEASGDGPVPIAQDYTVLTNLLNGSAIRIPDWILAGNGQGALNAASGIEIVGQATGGAATYGAGSNAVAFTPYQPFGFADGPIRTLSTKAIANGRNKYLNDADAVGRSEFRYASAAAEAATVMLVGAITKLDKYDWFTVSLKAGETFSVETKGLTTSDPVDLKLLYYPTPTISQVVTVNPTGVANKDPSFNFTAQQDGTYYFSVQAGSDLPKALREGNYEAKLTIKSPAGFDYKIGDGDSATVKIKGIAGNAIIGGDGDEIVIGGAGNDSLNGGGGHDVLVGGGGADTFVIGAGDNGVDRIADYSAAQGDVLNLADLLTVTPGPGSVLDSFVSITAGAAGAQVAVNADGVGADFVAVATLGGLGLHDTVMVTLDGITQQVLLVAA
ncbi:MAG: tandem-95 repeat protein, partial [Dongiaceae bacterium]